MMENFDMITQTFVGQIISGYFGTVAFAIIFGVPRKFFNVAGIVGAIGWTVYVGLQRYCDLTGVEATFCASMTITFASRCFAVTEKCPVTLFRICGLIPLVPGAGIYWTIYYLMANDFHRALSTGFVAIKMVIAIVLGMVIIAGIPNKFFKLLEKKKKIANS
jgi:uncharacterized membrane protein YjjB (DUF3815 family)